MKKLVGYFKLKNQEFEGGRFFQLKNDAMKGCQRFLDERVKQSELIGFNFFYATKRSKEYCWVKESRVR